MSLAGRPSAKLRPIRAVRGNEQRAQNELRRRCACGRPRGIRPDGDDHVEIVCTSCGLVALRIRFQSAAHAKRARAEFARSAAS